MPQLTNCIPCTEDLHDECKGNCLCKENNHGVKRESLRDGVREHPNKPADWEQFKEVWKEIYDNQREFSDGNIRIEKSEKSHLQ